MKPNQQDVPAMKLAAKRGLAVAIQAGLPKGQWLAYLRANWTPYLSEDDLRWVLHGGRASQ